MGATFTYTVLGCEEWNEQNDNVDVYIVLESGERYSATFFTLENIGSLFDKNSITGEFAGGVYLWASRMIIVKRLTRDAIQNAIADLIEQGELTSACERVQ